MNTKHFTEAYRKLLEDIPEKELAELSTQTFSAPLISKVFLHFIRRGASTALIIQHELQIPEATSYRALDRLRKLKIIKPGQKIQRGRWSRGGPLPTVYIIEGTPLQIIKETIQQHNKTTLI